MIDLDRIIRAAAQPGIVFTLPLPPRESSPNARPHHMAKARAAKAYRAKVRMLTSSALRGKRPLYPEAMLELHWIHKTAHRLDSTNAIASFKAGEDGLADAGLLLNDRGVTWLPVKQSTDKKNPRVILTCYPLCA